MSKGKQVYYVIFQDKKEEFNQVKGVRLFYERIKAIEAANNWTAENEDLIYTLGSAWIE